MEFAAPDHLRGRVIALYFGAVTGTSAIAPLMTGYLCTSAHEARLRRRA